MRQSVKQAGRRDAEAGEGRREAASRDARRPSRAAADRGGQAAAQRRVAEWANESPRAAFERIDAAAGFVGAGLQRAVPEEEELLQGKGLAVQRAVPEEEELLQGKHLAVQRAVPEEEELMQGKGVTLQRLQDGAESVPPNRTGLPDRLKAGVESMSGMDLSDVRVHAGSSRPAQVGALAFTQGDDIHVGPGAERHLPHEAWHVVQQRRGIVAPTTEVNGVAVNDDDRLEREADVMGEKAARWSDPEA